jgi:hypothetical protein
MQYSVAQYVTVSVQRPTWPRLFIVIPKKLDDFNRVYSFSYFVNRKWNETSSGIEMTKKMKSNLDFLY